MYKFTIDQIWQIYSSGFVYYAPQGMGCDIDDDLTDEERFVQDMIEEKILPEAVLTAWLKEKHNVK